MREKTYATEAVVLARRNYGEADRLLTVFSKHYGKLRVIAKGIRRPTSRKKGALELFSHVRLFIAKGRSIDIITDAEVKNSFLVWRKDLTKVGVAYHLTEVVTRLSPEHQEHKEVFDLLLACFQNLSDLDYWGLYPFIQSFKVRLLEELGYLERGKNPPSNLDSFIGDLINGELRTKRFLKVLK
ncbi:MAG: DNA repair protein RecO [Candidatus Blackburnbacteria bacterium]|nr:DNA repair protein RecO [Candidatus Blackburnbacteria bacterium]